MVRLLVLGADGLLGSNVVSKSVFQSWSVSGTYHSEPPAVDVPLFQLRIEDGDRFQRLIERIRPDVVVNCAAMTDVDECEQDPERAQRVNGRAPGKVAAVCQEHDIQFVHVSTDYVFDGKTEVPYDESAEPDPIQEYSRSKLAGERLVRQNHTGSLIVRLSFLYGSHKATPSEALTGFPAWVCRRIGAAKPVPLLTDQYVSPTRAGQAAETILELVQERSTGRCHVACRSCLTPYDFGAAISERLSSGEASLERISSADFDRPAARPRHTCLDVRKVESRLGRRQPRFEEDLRMIADRLRANGK